MNTKILVLTIAGRYLYKQIWIVKLLANIHQLYYHKTKFNFRKIYI